MRVLLLIAALVSATALAGATTVLTEDWETGVIDETIWKPYGVPPPVLYEGEGVNGSWGLDCNGDQDYGSGLCTHANYDLSALPWVFYQANCSDTHDSWQYVAVSWSRYPSQYYGGTGAQPQKLCTLSILPAFSVSAIQYYEATTTPGEFSREPWLTDPYHGVWMGYEMRINPWGTISFFREDTLRWESNRWLETGDWMDQPLVLDGESMYHHQILDELLISFPSLREDFEQGGIPLSWYTWGNGEPGTVPGGGIYGSTGLLPGEGEPGGAVSFQVFPLSAEPLIWFSLLGSSLSSGIVSVGWSSSDASGYLETPPELLAFVQADPASGLITLQTADECFTEEWETDMNDVWQQFTIRVNGNGSLSFFRNDTLRHTSATCLELSLWDSQSLAVQGQSEMGFPVIDELHVYPSVAIPMRFIQPLSAVCTLNGAMGWAVGGGGRLLATENFGETWELFDTGTTADLHSVDFVSSSRGWAAGDSGRVLITLDGENWSEKNTGHTGALLAVDFADGLTGWAAGEDAVLIRTDNAGFNWAEQTHPLSGAINGLSAVNDCTAYICGASGQAAVTRDGTSWSLLATGVSEDLNCVDFFGPQRGWIAGENGTILCTSDGGESWTAQDCPVNSNLTGVSFFDAFHGFAVGNAGTALFTSDGGGTWQQLPVPSYEECSFTGVSSYSQTAAWAVSEKGTLLLGDFYSGAPQDELSPAPMLRVTVNPVPTGGVISAEISYPAGQPYEVSLYDTCGRRVQFTEDPGLTGELNTLYLPATFSGGAPLPPGVYFLRCVSGDIDKTEPVVLLGR